MTFNPSRQHPNSQEGALIVGDGLGLDALTDAPTPPEGGPADPDVTWALNALEQEADICSAVNGPEDDAAREARRLETTVKRPAREAGYRCVTTD